MSNLLRLASGFALMTLGYALGHLSLVASDPVPAPRGASYQPRASQVAMHDGLHAALLENDVLTRAAQTARVLATIPLDQTQTVLATVNRIALAPGDMEVALVAEWMARSDPAAALEWARGERYANHSWVLGAVVRSWARQDPQAAVSAYYAARGSLGHAATLISLVLGWEESNHPGLNDFMLGLEQGEVPQVAIEALVRRKLARDGIESVVRWAESLPADRPDVISRYKRNAMRRTASAIADYDPQFAWEWANSFGEGPYGRGAYRRVATRTARLDGPGTMKWLSSVPAGPQRDGAVQEAFRMWMSTVRDTALAWLVEQEDASYLDPAHDMYAQVLGSTVGHEEAIARVEMIDSPVRKRQAAVKVLSQWHRREPENALAWLDSAPEWLDEQSILQVRDPAAARRKREEARAASRDRYEARRAAALAEGNGD